MENKSIRVLVVDANPTQEDALRSQLAQVLEVEVVGIAHSQRAALNQVETTQPDLVVVDLMLPGYRSVDLISQVSVTHPKVRILALSPGDIPHDRVILSVRAGALGTRGLRPAIETEQPVEQGCISDPGRLLDLRQRQPRMFRGSCLTALRLRQPLHQRLRAVGAVASGHGREQEADDLVGSLK